jgi:multidrug efflux pump
MIAWLVRNKAVVYLLVACTFAFGLITYNALPREAQPDVKIPVVMVSTPYIGVSPEDIESLVTVPMETELAGLKGLKKMSSTSAEGASIVTLEFEPEVVIEEALQRVRDRVSRARGRLPADVEESEVREISFSDFPVLIVTIAGPIDEQELKRIGERLETDVNRIPGVLEARLSGGRKRQIRVQVDGVRLAHYGLSLTDVQSAVQSENVNIPGGEVLTGGASYLIRVPGEIVDPMELEAVAIKRVGDRPVFVRDVAKVVDGFEDRTTYARMNGQPAVSLSVTKRTGQNILQIADAVKEVTARHAQKWPQGVSYRVLGDQSKFVADIVGDLENNIISALILVVGVIMFVLGVRNSLFVALTIPLSMLISFIVIWAAGMTLNMIVLFALILALGMLVDNGIVLVENIYRHLELGEDLVTASIEGTKEVAVAVTTSTLTTVAAFVPLAFWTGIMGQFMGYLPKTVIVVLLSSLVASILVLPVFTARFMKLRPRRKPVTEVGPFMAGYRDLLGWSIRHRYLSIGMGGLTLVGTLIAYGMLNHGTEFFPETEPNRATLTVRAPDGTNIEATDAIVQHVEDLFASQKNVAFFVTETGVAGGGMPLLGAQAAPNQGKATVDFRPTVENAKPGEDLRVEPTVLTIDRIRHALEKIAGAEVNIDKERMGPPVGAPIAVEVSGDDFHQVGALARRLKRELALLDGVAELSDDYRVGRPELRLRIDRGAAKRVGASTQSIAGTVRTAVAGSKVSALRDGEDEYDIVVQLDPRDREDMQSVLNLRIPGREDTSPDTFAVPLSTVASYELRGGSGSIRHIDQDLVVTITGDVAEGFNENAVRHSVEAYLAKLELPAGFHARLGGANDEQRSAQEFLGNAFLVAIALIALVLVAQFNRFDIPFIILTSVVLSLIGVLWGLILTGKSFGVIMTGIGIISLAGVVVNNAIVLLDFVEQLRHKGMKTYDALLQAGMTRVRPVLLTAGTTMLGLFPMALAISIDFRKLRVVMDSQNSQFWGSMAVAVIFGLAVATVLTLVMVPTLYSIFEDFARLRARLFSRSRDPEPLGPEVAPDEAPASSSRA